MNANRERREDPWRHVTTPEERRLWEALRAWPGADFRRHARIGGHFVDFVCFERLLAVELGRVREGDAAREAHLKGRGFALLRFGHADVREDLGGVLARVARALAEEETPVSPPGLGRHARR